MVCCSPWGHRVRHGDTELGEGDNRTDFTIVFDLKIEGDFEFEGKKYIVCAEVVGDALSEEGLYLFESVSDDGEEITVKNIDSEEEYDRVVDAYCALEDAE